jgi:SAM-dependent methyltransferase
MSHLQQAEFIERTTCINCGSSHIAEISRGNFQDQPLKGFMEADPWGENPAKFLESAHWEFCRCVDCTQMFHRRILNEEWNERRFSKWMSKDAIKEFENRLGPAFEREFQRGVSHVEHLLRLDVMTRAIRKRDEAVRLLDFGCGFGSFLETASHFGFEAYGVDRSEERRDESSVEIFATIDELPKRKFHAITLFEVLEHLDSPSDILGMLHGLLERGGILVLETPDCSGVTDIKTHSDFRKIHPLEHINAFTNSTLISIAKRNGFKLCKREPAYVLTGAKRAAKRFARHALNRDSRSSQLYFQK